MEQQLVSDAPRQGSAALRSAEYALLCENAIAEWTAGGALPSLDQIRKRGTVAQYNAAVDRICRHEDKLQKRDVRKLPFRRAPRGD